ncbi:MAG: TetR/AcrR family transcriptional regulator [Propionibacteriales bacterium]|nr:TetR/AcrR family transcriptional regulator [Propionibacteriales bacterium]
MEHPVARARSSRQVILDAAVELIRERGVAGTSISDVVARSGTSAGAIYHHFANKEELILEVGRTTIARPLGMILDTTMGLEPAAILRSALGRVAEDEGLAELLLQLWAGAQSDPKLYALLSVEGRAMRTLVVKYLDFWISQHAPDLDAETLTSVLLGLVMGFAVQRALSLDTELDSYADMAARLLAEAATSGTRG